MNLDEFIKDSLLQVLKGIKEAQDISNEQGPGTGAINPKWGQEKDHYRYTSEVSFDIAISASKQSDKSGRAGLRVVALDIEGEGTRTSQSSHVSRVSFKVPIALPAVIVTDVSPPPK